MAYPPDPGRQANAYIALNDYATLAIQLSSVLQALFDLKSRETANNYSEIYRNTETYQLNPDGTPGNKDPQPVPDHPMTGTYLSESYVSGFMGYIVNDLYNFLTGVTGPTVADRRNAIKNMLP